MGVALVSGGREHSPCGGVKLLFDRVDDRLLLI